MVDAAVLAPVGSDARDGHTSAGLTGVGRSGLNGPGDSSLNAMYQLPYRRKQGDMHSVLFIQLVCLSSVATARQPSLPVHAPRMVDSEEPYGTVCPALPPSSVGIILCPLASANAQ